MESTKKISKSLKQKIIFPKISLLLMIILSVSFILKVSSTYTNTKDNNLITVHVIPHTHDDAGWLATFEDYYTGNNRQSNCVECILNTMLSSLSSDSQRTFTYTEISYFEKWYKQQNEGNKLLVKKFVEEKRLEFLLGGWVMNDEADPYYQDIIDQIRLGMQFLKKEFNFVPKTAWFLDPFGHSLTNAYLMSKLGYENMVIVRIDYRDKEKRINEKKMEFLWKPYEDIDKGVNSIFTHITYAHYNPEKEFPEMLDRYTLSENSIRSRLSEIYKNISNRRDAYDSNEVMFLYGDDFTFNNNAGFINMDTLIKVVSEDSNYKNKMKFVYSTPSKYFNSIRQKKNILEYPSYENKDFFPYADGLNEYWTGYFTSRPYLKGIIRDSGKYLSQSSKFVFNYLMKFYLENKNSNKDENKKAFEISLKKHTENFDVMRRQLGIAQHHDAVTGTARNNVSDDYIYRLNKGIKSLSNSISEIMSQENFIKEKNSKPENLEVCLDSVTEIKCVDRIFTEKELDNGVLISVINPGNKNIYPKFLKINVDKKSKKILVIEEILKENNNNNNNKSNYPKVEYDLFYENELGYYVIYFFIDFSDKDKNFYQSYKNFSLKLKENNEKTFDSEEIKQNNINEYAENSPFKLDFIEAKEMKIFVSNGFLKISQEVFDDINNNNNKNSNGKYENYNIELAHGYFDYYSYNKNCQGAYMMSTNKENPDLYKINNSNSFISKGRFVTKINIKFEYSSLIVKIYPTLKEKNFNLDVQSILHKYEPKGQKEFILITKSNIDNTDNSWGWNEITEFYTDTNGMRVLKRIKNHRDEFKLDSNDDKTSGNFYPIGSVLYIKDKTNKNKNLFIFNDRAQGASSIHKGEILFDISRWGDRDDRRGLSDGLYEYQSSRNHFGLNHVIAFSNNFNYNNIYNYIQNKPLSVIYTNYIIENNESKNFSEMLDFNLNKVFEIGNEDCFAINYYLVNDKKILVQFYNKSDPNLFQFENCWVKLEKNESFNFTINNMKLNGVEYNKNKINPHNFLKKRFFAPLEGFSQNNLYEKNAIKPQDFYTLLFEFE
jgi:lysosomal alpha-mannosidase